MHFLMIVNQNKITFLKTNKHLVMNLESIRLLLKEISWEDLENIHRLFSFPEVDEFNTLGIPKILKKQKE